MSFTFRPAVREGVGLLIGLSSGTGGGKTFSALELATGMAGGKPIALIDTESGRAKHYADRFRFDHGDLTPPFTPDRYAEAVDAADKAKYAVVIVDSASHEWAGEDGILDWQEQELTRMAGDNFGKRESCKMTSWIKPKMAHKHMVSKLLQVRAHIILCFRAEPKIEMVKGDDGKMKVREKQSLVGLNGWIPICEKNLPFEMTASFLLMADRPGVPMPIKLEAQHRPFFPLDQPITAEAGRLLAQWAAGGVQLPAVATDERAEILTRIKTASGVLKLTSEQKRDNWHMFCGDAKPGAVTVEQLTRLCDALTERAMESV